MQSLVFRASISRVKPIISRFASSDSFTIQDPKDFDDRVKNSKVPVIVDFFAT